MDKRLSALGRDRKWLTNESPYKTDTIRQALAPNGQARSDRLQQILSDIIEKEEQAQKGSEESPPGVFDIFQTAEELSRADLASRAAGAPSLAEFCRQAIELRANEILAETSQRAGETSTPQTGGGGYSITDQADQLTPEVSKIVGDAANAAADRVLESEAD